MCACVRIVCMCVYLCEDCVHVYRCVYLCEECVHACMRVCLCVGQLQHLNHILDQHSQHMISESVSQTG